jgi:hypothetical protein
MDSRVDPFWEFGSFGCTGCHRRNLLNPKRRHVGSGDRLAFVQGGPVGCRLLLITPPVKRINHPRGVELCWDAARLPFRYGESAPLLAGNDPDVPDTLPELGSLVNPARRTSAAAKLASLFRTRCKPLHQTLACELLRAYSSARGVASQDAVMLRSDYSATVPGIGRGAIVTDRRRYYRDRRAELSGCGDSAIDRCRREDWSR